jgi:type VI secretion system protein ImpE
MLEAVVNGRYYWIPFDRLRRLHIEKPVDLRDFVWAPAELVFANGGETVALIPARYPGTESAAPELQLARRTEWNELGPATFVGIGQRMFTTDQGELSVFDVDIRFDQAAAAT